MINELYARYPDQSAHTWSRLHSEDDRQFLSALDELYVHHLLARRYRVKYEEGAGRQPDFRLCDNADQYVGRVEVLTLMQRQEWNAEERRHGQPATAADDAFGRLRHQAVVRHTEHQTPRRLAHIGDQGPAHAEVPASDRTP